MITFGLGLLLGVVFGEQIKRLTNRGIQVVKRSADELGE